METMRLSSSRDSKITAAVVVLEAGRAVEQDVSHSLSDLVPKIAGGLS